MSTVNKGAPHAGSKGRNGWKRILISLALCMIAKTAFAQAVVQKTFASPEEGVNALVEAVRTHNLTSMSDILGPDGDRLISSGDKVADKRSREAFIRAYNRAHRLQADSNKQYTLLLGKNEWPLPIPLVRSNKGWYFDTDQGDDEILARRIGKNEITAVRVLLEIADSEREYAALNRKEDGQPEYAAKIISTPGKQDGLYWPTSGSEPLSPIGELLAAAEGEGYGDSGSLQSDPYHGYLYRILTRQGEGANGGAYDYFAEGRMTRGFAAIAYPARYGASGIMTFIVSHDGQVYEKNLGKETSEIATRMTSFNPDSSWHSVDLSKFER